MTAPVFVVDPAVLAGVVVEDAVEVTGPEGRHAVTVRRLTVGEQVVVVDGRGTRVRGTVTTVQAPDGLRIRVDEIAVAPPAQPRVVVVQAIPKGDRGELAVETLTEVGVDAIVPWAASRCVAVWRGEKADRGVAKWRRTAVEAAKQSRRDRVPEVTGVMTTSDVVEAVRRAAAAYVLHETATVGIAAQAIPSEGDVVLIVGPEGGVTDEELAAFTAAGAVPARLGPTVLRTSTAGAVATAVLLSRTPRWSPSSDRGTAEELWLPAGSPIGGQE